MLFLFNRKPDASPPPVLPNAQESLQRAQQRAFVNFINVFQAEDYDIGGPEIAFHFAAKDLTSGIKYRTDAVNILPIQPEDPNAGFLLGNLHPGDWMQYTVSVPTDGNYELKVRAPIGPEEALYSLALNGRSLAQFKIPKQDSNSAAFVTVNSDAFDLPAGQHTLHVEMKQGNEGRLDWFQGIKNKEIEPQQSSIR